MKKNVKITKEAHVEILISFKPEVQLKDTEFALKNKLQKLLTKLKGFKFVTTLLLVFKKNRKQ